MKKILKSLLFISMIFILGNSEAFSQDLTVVYDMIDRLEARLNAMDKDKAKELNKLAEQLENLTGGEAASGEITSLNSRLDQYAKELESFKLAQSNTADNENISGLITDLRGLTAELKSTIENSSGATIPEKNSSSSNVLNNSKLSGYMFGDYYYEFSHPDSATNAADRNSFQFRRIYLTYDNNLSDNFSVRFRLEMKSVAGETVQPFVKNAYLSWKNLIPHSKIYFGIQGTPIWKVSEKLWGYRSVDKTIMDKRKIGSSSDMGLGIKGSFIENGNIRYHFLIANGSGKKGESDTYKKVYLSIPVVLMNDFHIVPFIDYEKRPDNKNRQLLALFAGIKNEYLHGGIEFFQKTYHKELDGKNKIENGFSVFGAVKLTSNLEGFARFDTFEPNKNENDDKKNYIISGVDLKFHKNFHLIPNVKIETYEADDKKPNTIGSATFYFKF